MAKAKISCKSTVITFKTKRGKKVSFRGHSGAKCPKRKKPSTKHLGPWKAALKTASPQCAKKFKGKAFRACVKSALKHVAL